MRFAAVLLALSACIKYRQDTELNSDGSGRIAFLLSYNLKSPPGFVPGSYDPLQLEAIYQGFVAFTPPAQKQEKNGWVTTTFTGYFEDINKVKIWDMREKLGFTLKPDKDGMLLEIRHGLYAVGPTATTGQENLGDAAGGAGDLLRGFLGEGVKGLDVMQSYKMPGAITKAEGLKFEASTARATVTEKDIDPEKLPALQKPALWKIWFKRGGGDIAGFRGELERAKAEWKAFKSRPQR